MRIDGSTTVEHQRSASAVPLPATWTSSGTASAAASERHGTESDGQQSSADVGVAVGNAQLGRTVAVAQ